MEPSELIINALIDAQKHLHDLIINDAAIKNINYAATLLSKALSTLSISISDPSHISCVANDYGYEHVFARYIQTHGQPNDVLLAISTSGNSKNVILAAEEAKKKGMSVISLTGKESILSEISDIKIITPAGKYADRVQELHIKVIHILIQLIENMLFPA